MSPYLFNQFKRKKNGGNKEYEKACHKNKVGNLFEVITFFNLHGQKGKHTARHKEYDSYKTYLI